MQQTNAEFDDGWPLGLDYESGSRSARLNRTVILIRCARDYARAAR
jgi:hypothetical protein